MTSHYKARPNKSGIDYGERDYIRSVRSIFHGLWAGSWDKFTFVDDMVTAIYRNYAKAFESGAAMVGVSPMEITREELAELQNQIFLDIQRLPVAGDFVESHSRENGFPWSSISFRAEMWVARYGAIKSMAMAIVGKNAKLKWVYNPLKEHCPDCLHLNGRVYRASTWQKYDLRPRHPRLACRGKRCGCAFVPTNDPVTPGRPPTI